MLWCIHLMKTSTVHDTSCLSVLIHVIIINRVDQCDVVKNMVQVLLDHVLMEVKELI